ncbi:hypothetical protein pEaSNUABM25_00263 [Erwinia phage pEa_SNUABM_25]|nr:hypothetical protein pEaSNUABM25_00263 [Erwinia phage pEa_SNUABM_25]
MGDIIYEWVHDLEGNESQNLPILPPDIYAYVRDAVTGARTPINFEGRTELQRQDKKVIGIVYWSNRANLISWTGVERFRFTLYVVRAARKSNEQHEEAQVCTN